MKNFPRYLLGLPDNDDMFYSAHNQKGLDHKALLEHLKDKDPAYYYTDILVPNGRTLSDFILRRYKIDRKRCQKYASGACKALCSGGSGMAPAKYD